MSRAAGAGQQVQHPQLRERPVITTTRRVQYQRGLPLWYPLYLFYWYKSTNTDAEGALLAKARLEQLQTAEDPVRESYESSFDKKGRITQQLNAELKLICPWAGQVRPQSSLSSTHLL